MRKFQDVPRAGFLTRSTRYRTVALASCMRTHLATLSLASLRAFVVRRTLLPTEMSTKEAPLTRVADMLGPFDPGKRLVILSVLVIDVCLGKWSRVDRSALMA